MALTLVASLTGCATDSRDDEPLPGETDPDAPSPPSGGGGATTASPGFAQCGTELCLMLGDPANAPLLQVDGARVISFDGTRMLIIRIEQDRFLALSAVCTHRGCTVRYAPATTDIECPCHGSTFALDGAVTHGPAISPLATYEVTFDAAAQVVRVMLG